MRWLDGLRVRWRALVHRQAVEREMEDELAFHLEMAAAQRAAGGLSGEESRRRALIDFGGLDRVREEVREERGASWASDLARDLGLAWRGLRRTPAFTVAAVATLGLGIGATTVVVGVVDNVLLRPLPWPDADRLVVVWETDRNSGTLREPASVPDFLDFQERVASLDSLAAFLGAKVNLALPGEEPERLDALRVSRELAGVLGVRPLAGRAFLPAEDLPGGPQVVLLGEELWRSRFGADPAVLGTRLLVDDLPHTVVGVLPAAAAFGLRQVVGASAYGRAFTDRRRDRVDLWLPLQADPATLPRETHPILLLARLASGATVAGAGDELAAVAAELERAHPVNEGRGARVEALDEVVLGPVRPPLLVLLGAVALVLLVACANVAHLLLARAAARERETAVRRALGAGDRHLLRQSFAESAVLAALAAAAALALALGGLAAVRALAPADLPRLAGAGLDARTFLAALALAAAVAVVFALVPAVLARRRSLVWGLRGQASGAAPGGSRSLLVVVEVALAVALTVAAGILVRGFWDLWHVDPGFATRGVLKAQVQLPTTRYPKDYAVWPQWDGIHRLRRGLLERLESLPGVESAAVASAHPLDRGFTNSLVVVGREMQAGTWPEASMRLVSPGYFATLGVALREGRLLGTGDLTDGPRVAVVNESAVRRYFPGGGAVGSSLRLWGNAWRVVGVVADERIHGLAEAPPPAVYLSLEQAPAHDVAVLVRTAGEPLGLAAAVRAAIHEQDPALAVFGVEPLASTLTGSLAEQRFLLVLLGVFAAVALALAAIGVYGLLAYRVALRTPELGLRSALGAGRRELLGLVMGEGARLAGAGLLVGSLGALAARRVVVSLVAGSGAGGPGTWLAVVGVVGAAVVAATLLPARRAAAVDPMRALRAE